MPSFSHEPSPRGSPTEPNQQLSSQQSQLRIASLIERLTNADLNVRSEAATAVGKIGPDARDAVPALTALLQDPNEEVRKVAATALEKINPVKVADQSIAPETHGDTLHKPAPADQAFGGFRDFFATCGITWGSALVGFAIGIPFSPYAANVGMVLGLVAGIAASVAVFRKHK
jgi:hypothetical protein